MGDVIGMKFEQAHQEWINKHISRRTGERRRRANEGHGHAERLFAETVWWPAFGAFDHLHPEYEVHDFKDGARFLDFAYIHANLRLCIEIDGFGSHRRDMDRRQFSDELNRQNHLIIDGWLILRFTYDDVKEKPRQCQQILQQLFGRVLGDSRSLAEPLSVLEKETVLLAARQNGIIQPGALFSHLGIGRTRGNKLLRELVEREWLFPCSGTQRLRSYRLNENRRLP